MLSIVNEITVNVETFDFGNRLWFHFYCRCASLLRFVLSNWDIIFRRMSSLINVMHCNNSCNENVKIIDTLSLRNSQHFPTQHWFPREMS